MAKRKEGETRLTPDGKVVRLKGRPRQFCPDAALDAAMMVFWKKGYQGANLPDLTEAMGINRPSLYAAFGNKESLFRKVIDRYLSLMCGLTNYALAAPHVRDALRQWLSMSLANPKPSDKPRGCLLINGAMACADASEPVRRELADRRRLSEQAVRDRIARAVAEGEIPASTPVDGLSKFLSTFRNGLAVQQSGGAAREDLLAAVEVALKAVDAAIQGAK